MPCFLTKGFLWPLNLLCAILLKRGLLGSFVQMHFFGCVISLVVTYRSSNSFNYIKSKTELFKQYFSNCSALIKQKNTQIIFFCCCNKIYLNRKQKRPPDLCRDVRFRWAAVKSTLTGLFWQAPVRTCMSCSPLTTRTRVPPART